MTRYIHCEKHWYLGDLRPEDYMQGFQLRHRFLVANIGPVCDACCKVLHGTIAKATTLYRPALEGEPPDWESQYGTVISDEAAQMSLTMSGDGTGRKAL